MGPDDMFDKHPLVSKALFVFYLHLFEQGMVKTAMPKPSLARNYCCFDEKALGYLSHQQYKIESTLTGRSWTAFSINGECPLSCSSGRVNDEGVKLKRLF